MRWALWRAVHWVCGWVPSLSPWRGPAHGLRLPERRLDRLHHELPAALSRPTSYCALLPSEPSVWSGPPSPGLNDAPPEDDAHALYERAQQQLSIKNWVMMNHTNFRCYSHFNVLLSSLHNCNLHFDDIIDTLALEERGRGAGLHPPQWLHMAAVLQVQELDEDDRVDLQEAGWTCTCPTPWTPGTGTRISWPTGGDS